MNAKAASRGSIIVRRPTADWTQGEGAPAFTLDRPLAGLKVGLRHEGAWRSWILISSIWAEWLRRDGAEPCILETGERVGEEGEVTRGHIKEWADTVDCGISGLGTCGSCTTWAVHDAVSVESREKPAVVAICDEFVPHGRNIGAFLGHPNLKVLVLPYPLEARPEVELRQIAEEYYPRFLAMLGVAA